MRRKIAGRYNRFLLAGFWIEEKPAKRKTGNKKYHGITYEEALKQKKKK